AAPVGMGLWGDLHLRWQRREERGAEQWRKTVRRVHVVPDGVGNRDVDWPERRLHPGDRQRAAVVRPGCGASAVVDRTVRSAREVVDAVGLLVVDALVAAQCSPEPEATTAAVTGEGVAVGRDFNLELGGRTVVRCRWARRCDHPCGAQASACNQNSRETGEFPPCHDQPLPPAWFGAHPAASERSAWLDS